MSSWVVELSEFNIRYEPHCPIKAQCLLDFVKDPTLLQYYHLVCAVIQSAFDQVRIEHILRTDNIKADILSKLASTKLKSRHRSLLQQTLSTPSITNTCHNLTHTPANNLTHPQAHN